MMWQWSYEGFIAACCGIEALTVTGYFELKEQELLLWNYQEDVVCKILMRFKLLQA